MNSLRKLPDFCLFYFGNSETYDWDEFLIYQVRRFEFDRDVLQRFAAPLWYSVETKIVLWKHVFFRGFLILKTFNIKYGFIVALVFFSTQ